MSKILLVIGVLLLSACVTNPEVVNYESKGERTLTNPLVTTHGEIVIPDGFIGVQTQKIGNDVIAYEFRKPLNEPNTAALFKVSIFNSIKKIGNKPDKEKESLITSYLHKFINRLQNGHGPFENSDIEKTIINGIPAFLIKWRGPIDGVSLEGVMCTLMVRHSIVNISFFDKAGSKTSSLQAAMHSINNALFK
ncbi:MAG: hypothetical protein GY834_08805 [Bacteroidetes bacterium]|nr:hypothetical protein [Bacteroidota bacterium]